MKIKNCVNQTCGILGLCKNMQYEVKHIMQGTLLLKLKLCM